MKNSQNIEQKQVKSSAESVEEIAVLKNENSDLKKENDRLSADILYLKNEYQKLRKLIFGAKSERFKSESEDQLSFNLHSELPEIQDVEKIEIAYTKEIKKAKKKPVREALPAHLPRKEEIIEPENRPEDAVKIGENITEVLEYTPGKVYVRRIVRPKYAIKNTANHSENQIITADMPGDLPLPGSNAAAGLLAYLIISKYVDHLPFYRQVKMFKRLGVKLAESTINDWFTRSAKLLTPLYEVLKRKILESAYIQGDESPVKVLTRDKPGSTHKGWFWAYHSPPDNLVLFDYRPGRDKSGPKEMLENFSGILQTDGYAAYNQFASGGKIRLAACMAHARRKFFEAKAEHPEICNSVLSQIQELYKIEAEIREADFSLEEIRAIRQEKSVPLMAVLETYLQTQMNQVLPKSSTGKAIAYTLNLWTRLSIFLDNPEVLIDNNLIENSIRPIALGRKNYLFAGSHEGAKRAAMMYSFFGSCHRSGVEPSEWLKSTLEKISDYKANHLEELLPGFKG